MAARRNRGARAEFVKGWWVAARAHTVHARSRPPRVRTARRARRPPPARGEAHTRACGRHRRAAALALAHQQSRNRTSRRSTEYRRAGQTSRPLECRAGSAQGERRGRRAAKWRAWTTGGRAVGPAGRNGRACVGGKRGPLIARGAVGAAVSARRGAPCAVAARADRHAVSPEGVAQPKKQKQKSAQREAHLAKLAPVTLRLCAHPLAVVQPQRRDL